MTRHPRLVPFVSVVDPDLVTRWLAPQPDPVGTGPSVTDWLLAHAWDVVPELRDPVRPRPWDLIEALLLGRREQGVERYGTELRADSGRDATVDALQEAIDLCLYLAQAVIEGARDPGGQPGRRYRLGLALRLVADLAHEIELVEALAGLEVST